MKRIASPPHTTLLCLLYLLRGVCMENFSLHLIIFRRVLIYQGGVQRLLGFGVCIALILNGWDPLLYEILSIPVDICCHLIEQVRVFSRNIVFNEVPFIDHKVTFFTRGYCWYCGYCMLPLWLTSIAVSRYCAVYIVTRCRG